MNDANDANDANEASERERRLRALRDLAQEGGALPRPDGMASGGPATAGAPDASRGADMPSAHASVTALHAHERAPWWRLPALLVMLAVVVGGTAAAVVLRERGRAATSTAPSALTINTLPTSLRCLAADGLGWSPNQHEIAVVGYANSCAFGLPQDEATSAVPPGVALIFDTTNGHLLSTLDLSSLILGQVTPPLSAQVSTYLKRANVAEKSVLSFGYSSVLWSRDGSLLYIPFSVWEPTALFLPPSNAPTMFLPHVAHGEYLEGLLITSPTGKDTRAFLAPGADWQQIMPTEWNLQTGKQVALSPSFTPTLAGTAGPAAFRQGKSTIAGFTWGANGQVTSLPATSANLVGAPIGQVAGGQSVSVWQPGALAPNVSTKVNPSNPLSPLPFTGTFDWQNLLSATSPDGLYFMANVPTNLALPPTRDTALTRMASALGGLAQQGLPFALQDALAWSPDGKVLAAWHNTAQPTAGGVNASAASDTVSLDDTQSGQRLGAVQPTLPKNQLMLAEGGQALAWAPDGSRLAFADTQTGVLTIWGPGALPKLPN